LRAIHQHEMDKLNNRHRETVEKVHFVVFAKSEATKQSPNSIFGVLLLPPKAGS